MRKIKEISATAAAKMLGHHGGAFGLVRDLMCDPTAPIRIEKGSNGRWHGINELNFPVLEKWYELMKEG